VEPKRGTPGAAAMTVCTPQEGTMKPRERPLEVVLRELRAGARFLWAKIAEQDLNQKKGPIVFPLIENPPPPITQRLKKLWDRQEKRGHETDQG
jgi:hypothetical protein